MDSAHTSSHRKRHAYALVDDLFCAPCQVSCNSEASFIRHTESRRHRHVILHPRATSSTPFGSDSSPSPSGPIETFDRLPRTTAVDQMASIITTLWGSFGVETVQALFFLRRDSRVAIHFSDRLCNAETVEDYATLLLSVPNLALEAAKRARAALSCADLPDRHPTLRLDRDQRLQLQRECLHRALLTTILAENVQLLHLAVHAALHDGTARALITNATFDMGYLTSSLASLVFTASAHPDSPYHSAWHANRPHSPASRLRERRRSESNLEQLAAVFCTCNPSAEAMRAVKKEARQLRRDYLNQLSREGADSDDGDGVDNGADGAYYDDGLDM
jgi:hypothetical protein